jgi:beta-lactamase regulating signal transducer with metallopeptidase domain
MIPVSLSPLANHLWQSTLFAAAAWLLTLALRKNRADIRYALWLAASVKFLVPFALLVSIGHQSEWRVAPAIGPVPISHVVKQVSQTFALPATATIATSPGPVPILLFSIWFCGFAISAGVWMRFWRRFHAALQAATPLHLDLPIPVMISPGRLEPGVFGILKPVLLLPEGIPGRLTPAQLHAILAHELCHVRRRDNLTAAIHMLAESIFWFYPLVGWIGRRMVEERERACDEEVVRLGNEPGVYAEGILNVCRFYVQSPLACASGVTGADLRKRIESIVNQRISQRLTFARKLLLAGAGVVAVAGPVVTGMVAGILDVSQDRTMPPRRPVLRARFLPAQVARPPEPVPSITQRIVFEDVPYPPPQKVSEPGISGPMIEAIEFHGARRIPQSTLKAMIFSRAGGAYDIEALGRDSQALYMMGRFSDVAWETEQGPRGVIVRFTVVERPLIRSIEYEGDETVTVAEILERFQQRNIKLRAETLYDENELGRAAATVQELVGERGRQNIRVTPLVESIPPSTVKITFRVEEGQ